MFVIRWKLQKLLAMVLWGMIRSGGALPTGWIRVLIREPQGTLYEDTEARPMTLRTTDTRVDGTYPELLSPQIVSN